MFRYPALIVGPVFCLAGLLFGGPCSASSTTDLGIIPEVRSLSPRLDLLSLQHDLYTYGTLSTGVLGSGSVALESFTSGSDVDAGFQMLGYGQPHGLQVTRLPPATRTGPAFKVNAAANESDPLPMALWILGTGMIGLSAVGRRRAQPEPMAVPA